VFLILLGGLLFYSVRIDLSSSWNFVIDILKYAVFVTGLNIFFDLMAFIYRKSKKVKSQHKDNITVGILNLYYFIVFIAFILLTLSFLDIDLKTLFTTLSIVAAAIAIVSKDFLSALLGGFIITFSKELSIGDEVKIGEHKGKIIDLNLTKVNIKTEDDDIIFIPNDKAYNNEIINFTKVDNKKVNIRLEKLEQDLIDTLEEYHSYINKNSFILKINKIEKEGISFNFQYTLDKNNLEIENEIRRKTIRKVINRLTTKVETERMMLNQKKNSMTCEELWKMATKELFQSNVDQKHSFKQMVVSTKGEYPELRTVILREIDAKNHIWYYSDSRAPKVTHIQNHPESSILFYHPKKMLQIRMNGISVVHFSGSAYEKHLQIALQNPKDYQHNNAPGTELMAEKTDSGFHFCTIQFIPKTLDILLLGREKHTRAIYKVNGKKVVGRFVNP
jgi:small-conductance mechanosensitive channel